MPLPAVTNEYPRHHPQAISDLNYEITQETKDRLDKERQRTYLDHGGYGVAYDISPGTVEKITSDHKEYINALVVIKKQEENGGPLSYVVYVHSVEEIQEYPRYFRLILEKVIPLNREQRILMDTYFKHIHGFKYHNYETLKNEIELEKDQNFIQKITDFSNMIKKYNLDTWDVKGLNVGLRGENIVLLDIGAVAHIKIK